MVIVAIGYAWLYMVYTWLYIHGYTCSRLYMVIHGFLTVLETSSGKFQTMY